MLHQSLQNSLTLGHFFEQLYIMIAWLHFQFHLPHVTWNAVLAFLAVHFRVFNQGILPLFITLKSITCALGINL